MRRSGGAPTRRRTVLAPFASCAVVLLASAAPSEAAPPTQAGTMAADERPGETAATTASSDPPLTFATVLELAIARNPELAAARRGRAVREAGLRAARQYPNPELSFEAARDVPHETLSLGVPLDVFGQRSRRIDLAREELKLADVEDGAALQKLRRDVRLAFFGLLAAEHGAAVARTVRDVADRVRQTAAARVEEGVAPRLDLMQAELGVTRAQAELELARAAERAAQAELNALLDRPVTGPIALAGEIAEAPPLPDLARATAAALAANVELLAAGREVAIEERRLGSLKAERLPLPVVSLGVDLDAPGEFQAGARAGEPRDPALLAQPGRDRRLARPDRPAAAPA